MQYWFNVGTGQVETDETRSKDADVLGPYGSREDAASALQKVKERNEDWDEDDKAWNAQGGTDLGRDDDLED